MSKLRTIRRALLIVSISVCAAAQDNPPSQPNPQDQQQPPSSTTQPTTPSPAFGQSGQNNAPILNPENPPLSGLDEPSLGLKTASRSFISPALQVGESFDSNAGNQLNGSNSEAVTDILGALDLQKFWRKNDLFLEYVGGGAFGNDPYYVRQIQLAGLEAVTRWRTGQLTLRDAFNYLPDGSFYYGTAGGGLPGFGIANSGLGLGLPGIYHFSAVNNEVGIGTIPRLSNTGILDAVQALTPRSAITVVGAYSNSHFFHNADDFVNGDESTIEAGYSHLISRHDQIAGVYAYQLFRFPDNAGGELDNNVFVVRWSHTITGRMSFIAEVGPQYTILHYGVTSHMLSPAARAILRYRFEHAQLMVSYDKFISQGSGFFAGANTQLVQGTLHRPIRRTYNLLIDAGFSHNSRIQPAVSGGAGVQASSYDEFTAAAILRRHLGRSFDLIGAYRFAELQFDVPTEVGGVVGRTNSRNIGTIALEWHPKPTRIE
jgi:hypothetical protein